MADKPAFTNVARMEGVNFLIADGTTAQNVATGGSSGTRINSLIFHNKAATAREAYVALTDGTNIYRIDQVSINATAGATTDMLAGMDLAVDAHNNKYVVLPNNSWALTVALNAAVAADNDAFVVAMGGDF